MSRPITRRALRVLNSETFSPIELLELRIAGSTDASKVRLTNAGEEVVWGGDTYFPINMGRTQVKEVLSSESGDHPSVTMTFTNIDSQMATLLGQVELEGARCKLWLHDRRLLADDPTRTRDAILLIDGEVRNPVLTETTLVFQVVNVLSLMERIQIPNRMYQERCNATFGSPSCGVDLTQSPFTIHTTVISGSTSRKIRVGSSVFTEAGDPADPNDFWFNGYIVFKDGVNATQSRPIQNIVVGGGQRLFFVRYAFLSAPSAGDGIVIVRGCAHTKVHCIDRQGDANNFQGFAEVPFEVKGATNILRGY